MERRTAFEERNGGSLHRLSAIPGRERWAVEALLGRPAVAALIESQLGRERRIQSVEANAVTGRVLVLFKPSLPSSRIESLLASAVGSVVTGPAPGPDRIAGGLQKAGTLAGVSGGILLLSRWIAGGAALPGAPVLIGAAVVATAAVAAKLWLDRSRAQDAAQAGEKPHPLPRLLRFMEPHKKLFRTAAACSILKKITDLAPPLITGLALDIVANRQSSILAALGIASARTQILALAGGTVVIFLLESLFEFAHKVLWRRLAQKVQHDLRLAAYAHVQKVELSYLEGESTGELTTILNENINQLELFLNEGVNALLEMGTNVVVVVAIFALVSPGVSWIAMLPIPLIVWLTLQYHKRIRPLYAEVEQRAAGLSGQLVNNLLGITTIRSFNAEGEEEERIRSLSQAYVDSNRPASVLFAAFEPGIRIPVLAGYIGVLVAGGMAGLAGGLSAGQLAVTLFLIQRFLFPFAYLGQTVDRYQRTMAAVTRVFDLLETPVGPPSGRRRLPAAGVQGEVRFDEVIFGYPSRPLLLRGLSLRIPAGETAAIVGVTGSGKTTVAKLLLRFYEYQQGDISIDGRSLRSLCVRDVRQAIGLVSQDVFLFDGTIRENIAYGNPDVPFEKLVEAAHLAEARRFIEELPDQYETVIGERGQRLSGGQRQRLCIARAILKNPPILILDEATSSVDNETEAAIQRSLERISRGRTTLMIAHRLSTVRNAHQIFVMGAEGRIVEQGSHSDLVALDGLYASLWRVQTGAVTPFAASKPEEAG